MDIDLVGLCCLFAIDSGLCAYYFYIHSVSVKSFAVIHGANTLCQF